MISAFSVNDWVTLTIILLMGLLTLINFFHNKQLVSFLSFKRGNNYFAEYVLKSNTIFTKFNMLFLVFQIFVFALFLTKVDIHILNINLDSPIGLFFVNALFVFLFYLLRSAVGYGVSMLFNNQNNQITLTNVKLNILSKASIILLPFLTLVTYSIHYKVFFTQISLIILVLFLGFNYLVLIVKNQKIIYSNLFYFILYLCALEIIPLFFMFKLFINKV